jgi:hypothetical protein
MRVDWIPGFTAYRLTRNVLSDFAGRSTAGMTMDFQIPALMMTPFLDPAKS